MNLLNDAIQGQIDAGEYAQTAYAVGFGDGVRSWVTGDHGEDAALEEARSWHADQAYIDAWRAGREWAKGRRG